MKHVVDNFINICSNSNYYLDYCNYIRSMDIDTRYTFYAANTRVLIDMSLDKSFNKKGIIDNMRKTQNGAIKWLNSNKLTYEQWLIKFNKNKTS